MLTQSAIRDAEPTGKTTFLWDTGRLSAFGVRIAPGGTKAYVVWVRSKGRKRLVTLARCSEIGLTEARRRAAAEMVAVRDGAPDLLTRRQEARQAADVCELVDRFFSEYASRRIEIGRLSPRTVADYRKQARRYILPALGKLKVDEVKRRHVERMVDPLPKVQRNRILALTSRLFTLAETWELRPQHSNPARGIERAREEPRDRTLKPDELARLSRALKDESERRPAAVTAIRVAALTGLRIGEVLAIRWEHLDFETGRLLLPATKTGRRHHDLPEPALLVLSELPRWSDWVFTTTGKAAITYRTARLCFALTAKAAGIKDVRLHDLRRTVMTRAAAAGVGLYVLRDLLGHKTTAMADRYVRAVGDPVRDARQRMGAEVAAMMDGSDAAEVVEIRHA